MSYGNYGGQPRRGGPSMIFLVLLFIGGFFIMNFLRTQGSSSPNGVQIPDRREQNDYQPGDFETQRGIGRNEVEPKGGIYGEDHAERPASHPDAGDWSMEDVKSEKVSNKSRQPKSERTDRGDWTIEEVPTGDKKDPQFNVSKSNQDSKPKSKSTKRGDWELEEVDNKK